MRRIIVILLALPLFFGCSPGKQSTATISEEKALSTEVKLFEKDTSNAEVKKSLLGLYKSDVKAHTDKIEVLKTLTETNKWDRIITEYQSLHNLSNIINASAEASRFLRPLSYLTEIQNTRALAAEAQYKMGQDYFTRGDKESARKAYFAFKKALDYQPGYKDAKLKMSVAFENAVINVVVNPIEDNMFYFGGPGFFNSGTNYSNEYFQKALVRDLGGSNTKINGVLFYTDWDAKRLNIQPDWIVELRWADINIPLPGISRETKNVSAQIESGRDTSGKTMYQRVQGTLSIEKNYFTATGNIEVKVTDMNSRRIVLDNRYSGQYHWEEQNATYSGDLRALSSYDNELLKRSVHNPPSQQDVLAQLYQRVYPQVKSRLNSLARW